MPAVSILGDSISTYEGCNPEGFAVYYTRERQALCGLASPEDTWWMRVIRHRGSQLLINASYSGSMVEGAGFPAGECPQRAWSLTSEGSQPDDVIILMGINDYGWGSAHAQAAGRSAATPACVDLGAVPRDVAGETGEEQVAEFARAYGRMLAHVREACPQARVWCCALPPGRLAGSPWPTFAWNLRGQPYRRYIEAMESAARLHECHFNDLTAAGLDYEAFDGTHPTALGMIQIAELVNAAMDGRPVDAGAFLGRRDATMADCDLWRSRDWCPDRPCLGCRYAKGTGNAWYCVCLKDRGTC